jgi:hypothetical protein
MSNEFAVDWLEGGKPPLSAVVKEVMQIGFPDVWNKDDVPEEGYVFKASDFPFWDAVLEDCAKVAKREQEITKTHTQRLRRWLVEKFAKDENEGEDDGSKEEPLSTRCKSDLEEQGATKTQDLGYGEVSLFMGRSATLGEVKDWAYGGPPQRSVGGKDVIKQKIDNFDAILLRGIANNDASGIDAWITRTTSLVTASEHPFSANMASRTLQWWLRAKSTLKDPRALLYYVSEYRLERVGRLFPQLFDAEIAQRAMNMATSGEHKSETAFSPAKGNGGMQTADTKSEAKEAAEKAGEAMQEVLSQVSKLVGQMGNLNSKVQAVSDRMGTIEARAKTTPPGTRRCHKCGSTEHVVADCPDKVKKED